MPSSTPLPQLLLPFLTTASDGTLTLLTSTLGVSTNWLVLRFVLAALKHSPSHYTDDVKRTDADTKVVLVSWLRDASFWRDGARRIGCDCQRISIVDGLSTSLGVNPIGNLDQVEKTINRSVREAKTSSNASESQVLLVLDGIDFLLAATDLSCHAVMDMICELRGSVHGIVLAIAADRPLIHSTVTALETSQAALTLGLAHQARMVVSLRELETGVAKDVSGVLRITRGSGMWENENNDGLEDKECFYLVGNDGGVNVFERGA